jgi:hypothetical protein
MKIEHVPEVKAALQRMGKFAKPALATGITRAAEYAQNGVRRELPSRFTFRGTQAAFQKSVLVDKATTSTLQARVKVGSGNTRTATGVLGGILADREEGRTVSRTAEAAGVPGARGIAIPTSAVRTKTRVAQKPYRLADIRATLIKQREQRASGAVKYGARAVYKDATSSTGRRSRAYSLFVTEKGIYERTAFGGRSVVRMLYYLARSVRIPGRTRFMDRATELSNERMAGAVDEAIDQQLTRLGLTR